MCKQFIEVNMPDKNKSEKFIVGLQHGGQEEASEEEASSASDEEENWFALSLIILSRIC